MVKLMVGGRDVETARSFTVVNPFDSSKIDAVGLADSAQVDQALEIADKARGRISQLTRHERQSILHQVSARLLEAKEELALTLAKEAGKTLKEARGEVERASSTFAFAGDEAKRLAGEVIPFDSVPNGASRRGFSLKVPIGTVIAITPFNFPLNLAAHKVAPAIAAANPFILKPASQTPLTDMHLGRIIRDAGFPPEGISVLTGPGSTVGMQLVSDARARMVTFTGSAEVGKQIAGNAGFKKMAMELGANSAVVVADSADVEFACRRIVQGGFALAGQVCISVQRVLVHRSLFDDVVGRVVELAGALKVGDQLDETTDMGPMISEAAAQRLEQWMKQAVDRGAQIRLGGTRKGSLFSATVATEVPTDARIWKEEAFGPVVCVNPYRDFAEAVEAVNQSRYGLQAGVFTNSVEEAFCAIEQIDVGGVIVNDVPTYRVDHMPYGGVKDSGMGREGLKYAIAEMTEEKLVCFNFWRPE